MLDPQHLHLADLDRNTCYVFPPIRLAQKISTASRTPVQSCLKSSLCNCLASLHVAYPSHQYTKFSFRRFNSPSGSNCCNIICINNQAQLCWHVEFQQAIVAGFSEISPKNEPLCNNPDVASEHSVSHRSRNQTDQIILPYSHVVTWTWKEFSSVSICSALWGALRLSATTPLMIQIHCGFLYSKTEMYWR